HREIPGADRPFAQEWPRDRIARLPPRAVERDRQRRRALLARPRARGLSQTCGRRAAWLAGAELRLFKTFAALPARGEVSIRLFADGRRHPLRAPGRQRHAARISGRLDARRLPALRPHPRSRLQDADLLAATGNGSLPQRVRRGLGIRRAADLGLASGIVGPPRPIQSGIGIARLHERQGRRLVRAARPGVRPCAEADGRGSLDAALRDVPALPEPAPRILQRTVSNGKWRSTSRAKNLPTASGALARRWPKPGSRVS